MSLCPVCLGQIRATRQGTTVLPTVETHCDSIGGVCPMSGQPMPEWGERNTRAAVKGRSSGICEHCRMQRATDMHHRISRGVGGWWSPANVLHLCRVCHSHFTGNVSMGHHMGIILRRAQNPEEVPVMRADGEIFYATDEVAA
jgi:hypothetical protein